MSAAGVTVKLEPKARHRSARRAASNPPSISVSGRFSPKFTMLSCLRTPVRLGWKGDRRVASTLPQTEH
jgi:hypothetical protein